MHLELCLVSEKICWLIKILSVKASFAAAIRILISCNDLVSLLTVLPKKLNLLSFRSLMLHVGLSFWT